jgi:hypothetical protein
MTRGEADSAGANPQSSFSKKPIHITYLPFDRRSVLSNRFNGEAAVPVTELILGCKKAVTMRRRCEEKVNELYPHLRLRQEVSLEAMPKVYLRSTTRLLGVPSPSRLPHSRSRPPRGKEE